MHRCWLDQAEPLTLGEEYALSAEESAHVARVLRMRPDDSVQLIAADSLFAGELCTVSDTMATARATAALPSPECPVRITLCQGLPKQEKLEWIVQKATELGVWDVLPIDMERSIAKLDGKEEKKRERMQRIALEAAKQSGRAHVPHIDAACRFTEAMARLAERAYDAVLVAWEGESGLRITQAMQALTARTPSLRKIAVVIGPEGGISEKEITRLCDAGAQCVTLGKRILRTETAGLCALSAMMATLGEM